MAPVTNGNMAARPSESQMALAMAIVKQKPYDTSVKEYISQIRGLIKTADEKDYPVNDKFFDSVRFWQKAYEESQAEQTKLLDKIFELEQRNQSLLAKTRENSSNENKSSASTKRKAAALDGNRNGAEAARKRPRGQPPKTRPQAEPESVWAESDPKEVKVEPLSLMRPLYTMQRALQNKRSSTTLAIDAVTLCKAAERELLSFIMTENNSRRKPNAEQTRKPSLTALIRGVELAFHLAHRALRRVSGGRDDSQCKGQVTYYLVCLFESMITALTQHCATIARSGETAHPSAGPVTSIGSVENGRSNGNAPPTIGDDETAQNLTYLLCKLTLSLDLARPEDKEVLEGFLFITITRMGELLAFFTFSNWHLSSDVCPKQRLPSGLIASKQEELSPQSAQLEAKHLLILLNKALSRGFEASNMQSQLLQFTKDRLQKTLLQSVFGDDDPFFKEEGLTRPATPPPQTYEFQEGPEIHPSEWFIQGLWQLVGWDILAGGR